MHSIRIALLAVVAVAAALPAGAAARPSSPRATAPPQISGDPVVGGALAASTGTWTNSPTRYAYAWSRCNSAGRKCAVVSGATTQSYVAQQADVGYTMRVVVSAYNASGSGSARSAQTAVVAAAAADTTAPTAPAGLSVSGATTTQVTVSWSASTDASGVAGYRLFVDGAAAGTTASTSYTFGGLACASTHTFGVAAFDSAGNTSATSTVGGSTSACATTVGPASTGAPVVSGSPQVGQTLSTTPGTWSGSTPMSYAYAWQSCDATGASCTTIAGATASTYVPQSADVGRTLRSRVTATNGAGSATAASAVTNGVAAASSSSLALSVSGNQIVDANGHAVRLHGVNYSGTEYACIQGWGIFDGPADAASVKAIASWHANIVHLGLNEDCILGINGVPAAYAGANYMNAVVSYVKLLHTYGLYAEISLMWAAPGTQKALDHPLILDQDHAPAALQAIANAFKGDPATIIGLQSEPHGIGWACWRNGGSSCSVGYAALGMQGALDAVRGTGATNVVTASGIDYANNLSQWTANAPADALGKLAAEAHVYGGNACASTSCFDTNYAPVAQRVPVVFGETGETYDSSSCGSTNVATFMGWADSHGVGYEAWVWDTWGTCGSLISSFDGTPANAYAQWVRNHYTATFP